MVEVVAREGGVKYERREEGDERVEPPCRNPNPSRPEGDILGMDLYNTPTYCEWVS